MITLTGLWKPPLAKTPCTTQWVLCTNLYQKKHPELQLQHYRIALLQVVIQRAEEREEEPSKVLVWISSLIIKSRKSQALNWCRWDVQINNRFQRVTNWQKSTIYCGWFSSAFSQSLLRGGLVGMHNIELTRKRQKRHSVFRLSINHQHRQQLLKKQWKEHNKWPWNVENVKSLWPTI